MSKGLALLTSILVIACFVAAGVTISYQNYGWMTAAIIAGFFIMGAGIFAKRKGQ
ncbi:DUF5325 family protein [Terribacillus sp. 179-K 1B1 HS]|uniref:DUF5325 family protein n=1 Tax=Terribacillus TaxID=459532 RepID=UPI001479E4AB|nr:DUF5325 family protein [Terribacillus halophilus]